MQFLKNITLRTFIQYAAILIVLEGIAILPIDFAYRTIIAGVLIFALTLMPND